MKLFYLTVITCLTAATALPQAPTLQSLKGTYVFTQQGKVQNDQLVSGLGVMTLDGNGNVTCNESLQFPGANLFSNCSGKYYTHADGSGSIEILYDASFASDGSVDSAPPISTAKFTFYPVSGGKQLKGIRTENGVFIIASFEKY